MRKIVGEARVNKCSSKHPRKKKAARRLLIHAAVLPSLLLPPQVIGEFDGDECCEGEVVPEAEAEG